MRWKKKVSNIRHFFWLFVSDVGGGLVLELEIINEKGTHRPLRLTVIITNQQIFVHDSSGWH